MVLLNVGPMGPRGLGPNPFSTVSPCPPGFFFSKKASKKEVVCISMKIGVSFEMFAIVANNDLNLRLKICKIAI